MYFLVEYPISLGKYHITELEWVMNGNSHWLWHCTTKIPTWHLFFSADVLWCAGAICVYLNTISMETQLSVTWLMDLDSMHWETDKGTKMETKPQVVRKINCLWTSCWTTITFKLGSDLTKQVQINTNMFSSTKWNVTNFFSRFVLYYFLPEHCGQHLKRKLDTGFKIL